MSPASPGATPLTLCVYCGSRAGTDAAYVEAATAVGTAIGRRGWNLVYGGGKAGLMGVLADATLNAGGRVIGVIPERLVDRELAHPGLHELHVVPTMHERKRQMAERADAFIALPGGIGTLEELFEVWTWRYLGYHDQPIALLNCAGYFDGLLQFMQHTRDQGFVNPAQLDLLISDTSPDALLDRLQQAVPRADGHDDYSRI